MGAPPLCRFERVFLLDFLDFAVFLRCVRSIKIYSHGYKLSISARLENIRDEIKKLYFEIYKDDEIGAFTFIEARKIDTNQY